MKKHVRGGLVLLENPSEDGQNIPGCSKIVRDAQNTGYYNPKGRAARKNRPAPFFGGARSRGRKERCGFILVNIVE